MMVSSSFFVRFTPILALIASVFLPTHSAHAQDYTAWSIAFNNKCNQKVRVAIRYVDRGGEWQSEGFWSISPGETRTVAVGTSRTFFYYAAAAGARWQSEDHTFLVEGDPIPYKMRRWEIDANVVGAYTHNLLCPDGLSGYEVRAANYCSEKLRIGVRYVDTDTGEWVTSRAFALDPGKRGALIKTSNRDVWVHGGFGTKYFGRPGKKMFPLNGKDQWFFPIDVSDAHYLDFCR